MVIRSSGQSLSVAFFACTLIFHFKFAGLKLSATSSVFAFSLTRLNIFQNPFVPLFVFMYHVANIPENFLIDQCLSSLSLNMHF